MATIELILYELLEFYYIECSSNSCCTWRRPGQNNTKVDENFDPPFERPNLISTFTVPLSALVRSGKRQSGTRDRWKNYFFYFTAHQRLSFSTHNSQTGYKRSCPLTENISLHLSQLIRHRWREAAFLWSNLCWQIPENAPASNPDTVDSRVSFLEKTLLWWIWENFSGDP